MTVQVGRHLLGLRASTESLAAAARAVLAPSLVEGVSAPANVSLLALEARAGRGMLACYRSSAVVSRARSERRAIQAAIALLGGYETSDTTGLVAIPALVVVRDGRVALAEPQSRLVLDALLPRLHKAGWALADTLRASVDPSDGTVVLACPAVEIDGAALAAMPHHPREIRQAQPGRYRVATWLSIAGDDPQPQTAGARVARVAATIDVEEVAARSALEAVAAMLAGAVWATSALLDAVAISKALEATWST